MIFIQALQEATVSASYGAGIKLTVNKPYFDSYGIFGDKDKVYEEPELQKIWKELCKNTFKFDLENDYVKYLLKVVAK